MNRQFVLEDVVDKQYISKFALEYLKEHTTVNEFELQEYIFTRDEVGKKLSLQDIRDALSVTYKRGWIDVVYANKEMNVYRLPM
jgi:hypothetical protein